MPAIPTGGHVLITGAHCCDMALKEGLQVTGTVRSLAKGAALQQLFKDKPFNLEIVPNLEDLHGFDKVIKKHAFDGILHVASPVTFDGDDPDELIIPALHGVRAVLDAARKYGPTIKRIVYTSSDAAVKQPSWPAPQRFDERNWNTESPEECRKYGRKAGQVSKYRASKAIAERAFWEYSHKHKNLSFDLCAINPTDVGGPILGQAETYASLGVIQKMFYDVFYNGTKTEEDLPGIEDNLVDVRDIAIMQVKALLLEKAGGERIIGAAQPFCWQDITNIMHEHAPELKLPYGRPGGAKWADDPAHCIIMDGSKATRVLDFEYRPMRQTVIDMYEDLQGRRDKYGWSSNESEATFTSKSARGCASGLTAFFHSVLGQRSIKLEGDEKSLSTSAEKHHV